MKLDKYDFIKIIPAINIALSYSAVVLIIIVLFNLKKPHNFVYTGVKTQISGQTEINGDAKTNKDFAAISDFSEEIFKRKQLFNFSKLKNKAAKGQDFILLGLSIGDKNIAMIKDTKENKDYYCKEGDKIGKYNIKRIFKDKVILESENNVLVISQ